MFDKKSEAPAAAGASKPPFKSTTDTGPGVAFTPPRYYDRPGISPELASQGRQLESEYASAFPYGDYTYSQKGWGYNGANRASMSQSDIDLRNRYRLYESQAMGQSPVNTQMLQPPQSSAAAFMGDLAQYSPATLAYNAYTQGPSAAWKNYGDHWSTYGSMLGDAGKRVANRWGGNFDLQYQNDPYLDWSSYALEAAPVLLAAAATAGTSAAAQAELQGGRLAAPSLIRGFQPFAQQSANAGVRYLGRSLPGALNWTMSGVNPVPLIYTAVESGGLASLVPWAGAHLATRAAANNYANAARDVSNYSADNPQASAMDQAKRFGTSVLANGVSFDPTSVNPWGIGLGLAAPGVMEGAYAPALQRFMDSGLAQASPAERQMIESSPAAMQEYQSRMREQFNQSSPLARGVDFANSATGINPARMLGARSYGEQKFEDAAAADRAFAPFAEAFMYGRDPSQDPRVQQAYANASPEGKAKMQEDMQLRLGSVAPAVTSQFLGLNPDALSRIGSMLPENPQDLAGTQVGAVLMQSPMAQMLGGDPSAVYNATVTMANLNGAISAMQQAYQETGQAPEGYGELLQAMSGLTQASRAMSSGAPLRGNPFADALGSTQASLQKIIDAVNARRQANAGN